MPRWLLEKRFFDSKAISQNYLSCLRRNCQLVLAFTFNRKLLEPQTWSNGQQIVSLDKMRLNSEFNPYCVSHIFGPMALQNYTSKTIIINGNHDHESRNPLWCLHTVICSSAFAGAYVVCRGQITRQSASNYRFVQNSEFSYSQTSLDTKIDVLIFFCYLIHRCGE